MALSALETSDDEASRTSLVRSLDDVAHRLGSLGPTRLPLLSAVRITTPCPAKWESMVGTDRVRHCGICDKEVWNLTALDAEEAETFLAERRTQLPCLRLHRRRDGHLQDGACAPGRARLARAAATAATLGLSAALAVVVGAMTPHRGEDCVTSGKLVLRHVVAFGQLSADFAGDGFEMGEPTSTAPEGWPDRRALNERPAGGYPAGRPRERPNYPGLSRV